MPPGWRNNPSSFSRRARLASGAAIAAILVMTLDAPAPLLRSTALSLVATGAASLVAGSHRWATKPWLVFLTALLAGPLVLAHAVLITHSLFDDGISNPLLIVFLGLVGAIAGAAMDEALASAQTIRRHTDHGRIIWRSFFGLRSKRRTGRAVTLDDVLTRNGESR